MSSLSFWKPGTTAPGSSLDRATQDEGTVIQSAPSQSSLSLQAQRERLPISKHRDKILYFTIVVGQTGSGKTTQIPQYLLESGWAAEGNVIACTQPRRVAATSVATRVAAEIGGILGEEVGYTIRFEDVSDKAKTRIRYMTDGMLFRETLLDPLLNRYSVIMIDEAHERSLYTDMLLGVLKKIRRKRPSLRLVVSSATLDATSFREYFCSGTSPNEATIVSLEGRMYPVEVAYMGEPVPDYVRTAVEVAWNINLQHGPGDILIFLTGREDIERCLDEMTELLPTLPRGATQIIPLALHSGLSTEEQLRAFNPAEHNTRKVIAATNIAEIRTYNPTLLLSSLSTVPVSLASATQRAGRAGRTSPGVCYRLYPESSLTSLSANDLMKFEWISTPPAESVLRALEGLQVAECPVDLGIARMLFTSKELHCGEEVLTIAAMVAIQVYLNSSCISLTCFVIPDGAPGALAELERRKFTAEEGDHLTLLNDMDGSSSWCKAHALNFRAMSRAVSIRSQLKKYMIRFGIPTQSCEGNAKQLRQCLVSGYWRNAARWMADGTYRSVKNNQILHVHPTSVLFTRQPRSGWIVFHELEETKKTQIRVITEIEPDW
ncbi:P-loop containing nucleoside triphosphate hydrolase protein [Melanogaster broomeanus]|nr:P-loop containing nucleoside triphosphate hydrolase protein [Melanogaster broomeanus]